MNLFIEKNQTTYFQLHLDAETQNIAFFVTVLMGLVSPHVPQKSRKRGQENVQILSTKVYRDSRGTAPLNLKHGSRYGVSAQHQTSVYHLGKKSNPKPIVKEAGWVTEPVSAVFGKNILPIPEFEPRTIEPVASRCTDYSIPAPRISTGSLREFFLSLS
jgi:hypothetical protein